MNPIQAIDELITQTQQELDSEPNMYDMLRLEKALKALELVREMLVDAGHEETEPESPAAPNTSQEQADLYRAERAALVELRRGFGDFGSQKIHAIKAYRNHYKIGLKEAKIAVEYLQVRHGL